MDNSKVIARKYRPQNFELLAGQEAMKKTLQNSIKLNRIHHAYIFVGPRGTGKTTTARILAKCLNCQSGLTTRPCDECGSCLEIAANRSLDVIEIDAASNTGVDKIKEIIIENVQFAATRGRYKIYIIDEVHMLSNSAFNALLKTLEEPPPGIIFMLATTEFHKIPDTISSRCQVFEFRLLPLEVIYNQLRFIASRENLDISDSGLRTIAKFGNGSMRDAESTLDKMISFSGYIITDMDISIALGVIDIKIIRNLFEYIASHNYNGIVDIVTSIIGKGYDLRNFCNSMAQYLRDLLMVKISGDITAHDSELIDLPIEEIQQAIVLSSVLQESEIHSMFQSINKMEKDVKISSYPKLHIEIELVRISRSIRGY